MKKLTYISTAMMFVIFAVSCEQELVDNSAAPCPSDDPSIICPEAPTPPCPDNATAGNADFTKFVAIGTSYTAGFQAGALFTEGQDNSLANILATQFECVGGGAFNQPSINSQHGYNIFITPNPAGTTVFGRFRLQGTPPLPSPMISDNAAIPNPMVNPGFMYAGDKPALNNFSVPAIFLGQALIAETGDWSLAGTTPLFSPFYARFASVPGTSTLLNDAASAVANGGTFVLFWLGMDDALLNAAYGGDDMKAPLTSLSAFEGQYALALATIMANADVKGVVANFPNPFTMPHFTAVPWNAIPLDGESAAALTTNLANNYNAFLDGMAANTIITAEEATLRKVSFTAGQNAILLTDETLTDLSTYMVGPYEALQPYAQARQTKSNDIIPFATGAILGLEIDTDQILGVSVPVSDQYVLIPSESQAITARLAEFNTYIASVAASDTYSGRLAFADINAGMNALVTAQSEVVDGILITPNINPPTGIYSEDGLHPNSRGYAYMANIFIDAINETFDASVPKVNPGNYIPTGLPINP